MTEIQAAEFLVLAESVDLILTYLTYSVMAGVIVGVFK